MPAGKKKTPMGDVGVLIETLGKYKMPRQKSFLFFGAQEEKGGTDDDDYDNDSKKYKN